MDKDQLLACDYFNLQNGAQTRFWDDTWLGDKPFGTVYLSLYAIVRRKDVTVAQVLSTIPLNVSFRRALVDTNMFAWYELVSKIVTINLTNSKDVFVWN